MSDPSSSVLPAPSHACFSTTFIYRWKAIEKSELAKYEERAAADQKRYKAQLAEYLEKKKQEQSQGMAPAV